MRVAAARRAAPLPKANIDYAKYQMLRESQVATLLGVSTQTVRRWFWRCALIVQDFPGRPVVRVPRQVLANWIREYGR